MSECNATQDTATAPRCAVARCVLLSVVNVQYASEGGRLKHTESINCRLKWYSLCLTAVSCPKIHVDCALAASSELVARSNRTEISTRAQEILETQHLLPASRLPKQSCQGKVD